MTEPTKATEPSDTRSSEPSGITCAWEANLRDLKERLQRRNESWWILMPLRALPQADRWKREYVESGLHGLYGLTGFQCVGNEFGQTHTFTYDSEKKEWNR